LGNTDTIHLAIERVPMGENFEFSVALRGEIFMAGLLHQYYQQGLRRSELGFRASYVVLMPKIQWHVADHHTLEVLTDVRYWMFGGKDTDPLYTLPGNSWVFEPRLGYIYWNIDSPGEEYRASKLFPRIQGIAVGASAGVDVRSDVRSWGFVGDGRNDPTQAIWTLNQWLRGGWQTGERFRLELQETFNWGWNPAPPGAPRRLWWNRGSRLVYRSSLGPLAGLCAPRMGIPDQLVARQPAFFGLRRPGGRRVLERARLTGR